MHHNQRSHMAQTRSWVLQVRPDTAKYINLKNCNMDSWTGSRNRKRMWGEKLWNLNKALHIDNNILIIGSPIDYWFSNHKHLKKLGIHIYIYIYIYIYTYIYEIENVYVYISYFLNALKTSRQRKFINLHTYGCGQRLGVTSRKWKQLLLQ